MIKIVLAVDGSEPSLAATRVLIKHRPLFVEPVEIHLVHVTAPIPHLYGTHVVVDNATIDRIIKEDADQAMLNSKILLDKSSIPYQCQQLLGETAHAINNFAESNAANFIYVGIHGVGAVLSVIRSAIMGSTTMKLLHTAKTPVVVVHCAQAQE